MDEFRKITNLTEILQALGPIVESAADLGWDLVTVSGNENNLVAIAVVMPREVAPFTKRLRKRYRVVALELVEDEADLNH